jgi:hypothetical protein
MPIHRAAVGRGRGPSRGQSKGVLPQLVRVVVDAVSVPSRPAVSGPGPLVPSFRSVRLALTQTLSGHSRSRVSCGCVRTRSGLQTSTASNLKSCCRTSATLQCDDGLRCQPAAPWSPTSCRRLFSNLHLGVGSPQNKRPTRWRAGAIDRNHPLSSVETFAGDYRNMLSRSVCLARSRGGRRQPWAESPQSQAAATWAACSGGALRHLDTSSIVA